MAKEADLNRNQLKGIDALVDFFSNDPLLRAKIDAFDAGLKTLIRTTPNLSKVFHSFRSRIKEPLHLRKKIIRKYDEYCVNGKCILTRDNLGLIINDLVGVRILHLHTHQIVEINAALAAALFDFNYTVREGPIARTWDDELRKYYHENHIATVSSESMYTSVHYVVNFNNEKQDLTAEIQVRTLAEELWGEVEHNLNYPDDHPSLECREQIKVLARITSGATRLVDSIFLSDRLWREQHMELVTPVDPEVLKVLSQEMRPKIATGPKDAPKRSRGSQSQKSGGEAAGGAGAGLMPSRKRATKGHTK